LATGENDTRFGRRKRQKESASEEPNPQVSGIFGAKMAQLTMARPAKSLSIELARDLSRRHRTRGHARTAKKEGLTDAVIKPSQRFFAVGSARSVPPQSCSAGAAAGSSGVGAACGASSAF
jgi:hypothetical protein